MSDRIFERLAAAAALILALSACAGGSGGGSMPAGSPVTLPAGAMLEEGSFDIAAGALVERNGLRLACAGEQACRVTVNADGAVRSTGGRVTVTTATPPGNPVALPAGTMLEEGSFDIAAGALVQRNGLRLSCVGDRTCRVTVNAAGAVRSTGEVAVERVAAPPPSAPPPAPSPPMAAPAPTPAPAMSRNRDHAAIESAVRAAAAYDSPPGEPSTTAWQFERTDSYSGSGYMAWSQSRENGWAVLVATPWLEDGQLEFNTVVARVPVDREDPEILTGRFIDTTWDNEAVTVDRMSARPEPLRPRWRGFQASAAQEGGGTLNVDFFTDATDANMPRQTYAGNDEGFEPVIALTDPPVPAVPADRGYATVVVPEEGGLRGTLDGDAGRFACAENPCLMARVRHPDAGTARGWYPLSDVVFTPDEGAARTIAAGASATVPKVDYLSFGHWLYVPEDLSERAAYDFGVFAGGDDPFAGGNLMALTGRANYAGKAAGLWASGSASVRFTADVALTADFGAADAFGKIDGRVTGFALENNQAPPLEALTLSPRSWRNDRDGETNIFGTWASAQAAGGPVRPGGWVEADALAGEDNEWRGVWGGKFYGNGDSPTDHPGAFAGTFGAAHADRGSLAGSFGAHRQP